MDFHSLMVKMYSFQEFQEFKSWNPYVLDYCIGLKLYALHALLFDKKTVDLLNTK